MSSLGPSRSALRGVYAISLLVDGEDPLFMGAGRGDAEVVIGRGSQSSPFLRHRLDDASISRQHLRVEALLAAGTRPRARVTAIGANPVVVIRGRPPSQERTLLLPGQSEVLEDGDSFTFCRGFDGHVRVSAVAGGRGRDSASVPRIEVQKDVTDGLGSANLADEIETSSKDEGEVVWVPSEGGDDQTRNVPGVSESGMSRPRPKQSREVRRQQPLPVVRAGNDSGATEGVPATSSSLACRHGKGGDDEGDVPSRARGLVSRSGEQRRRVLETARCDNSGPGPDFASPREGVDHALTGMTPPGATSVTSSRERDASGRPGPRDSGTVACARRPGTPERSEPGPGAEPVWRPEPETEPEGHGRATNSPLRGVSLGKGGNDEGSHGSPAMSLEHEGRGKVVEKLHEGPAGPPGPQPRLAQQREQGALGGLQLALVRHGVSRKRLAIFRERAEQLGARAEEWPPVETARALELSDLMPAGRRGRGSLVAPSSKSPLKGKGRKRPRESRHVSSSGTRESPLLQPSSPSSLSPGEERSKEFRGGTSSPATGKPAGGAGGSAATRSAVDSAGPESSGREQAVPGEARGEGDGDGDGDGEDGHGRGLEELRRQGFTHVVCPSALPRRVLWAEIDRVAPLPPASFPAQGILGSVRDLHAGRRWRC